MPTNCEIIFNNNPMKVVYSGQWLRGEVRLQLTNEKNVRGVYIEILGIAHSHWSTGSGKNRRTHGGSEDYINERIYFIGGKNGDIRLSEGNYNYTFEYQLPAELPTSFEGEYGYIRYTARVVLDIPLWPDKTFKETFTVIRAVNLNEDPSLREPVAVEKKKKFFICCLLCCCSTDPMWISAKIPVGGYTPGQTLNVEMKVHNESNQPVYNFKVALIKQITYFTRKDSSRRKYQEISINEEITTGCAVNEEKCYRVNIEIPPIPPTEYLSSNIVHVRYAIRILGLVSPCHKNPVLYLPIVIGSYPLMDIPSTPLLPNDEPPTYQEAMYSKDQDGTNFKPKYACFKRKTSYSN